MDHEKLPSWVEECTALMGDACHPMLPYVAQGAAQAIEDGAVLGVVLSGVQSSSRQQIKNALLLYQVCLLFSCLRSFYLADRQFSCHQEVRKSRAEAIQASAADTRISLHLPDGKKQQERDENIRLASKGQGPNPDKVSFSLRLFRSKPELTMRRNVNSGRTRAGKNSCGRRIAFFKRTSD